MKAKKKDVKDVSYMCVTCAKKFKVPTGEKMPCSTCGGWDVVRADDYLDTLHSRLLPKTKASCPVDPFPQYLSPDEATALYYALSGIDWNTLVSWFSLNWRSGVFR